jgi:hypothetical protein
LKSIDTFLKENQVNNWLLIIIIINNDTFCYAYRWLVVWTLTFEVTGYWMFLNNSGWTDLNKNIYWTSKKPIICVFLLHRIVLIYKVIFTDRKKNSGK